MQNLGSLEFKNDFVSTFKDDESGDPRPRQTPGMLYSAAMPSPVKQVTLLAWSDDLAKDLEINNLAVGETGNDNSDIDILGGNKVTASMHPYAACYAGHQFGNWAGQLGDGRAITLGEVTTTASKTFELQLKGAGLTAYSRTADGRAVLRSSVREYIMSEAMHYLGVPTTRALSLVSTGDMVMRDMFYNGNPQYEPGAIVTRVAPSFLRFGNFEMPAARGEIDNLRQLVEWAIDRYYPHITGPSKVIKWYQEVVEKTASLMVEWLRVGFVHGVMNTDNMSILGLTIDYGPYSFVDDYDPNFTPNTTDLPGRRYAFGKQAAIGKWNLGCLGGALAPLFPNTDELVKVIDGYDDFFWGKLYAMMGNKLGFDELRSGDIALINQVEKMLRTIKPDMTIFYQLLIDLPLQATNEEIITHFQSCFYRERLSQQEAQIFVDTIGSYSKRRGANTINPEEAKHRMSMSNPRFIVRNYLLHQAIEDLEKGDDDLFIKIQEAMKEPYANIYAEFFARRPNWAAQKAGCSMLSCSS